MAAETQYTPNVQTISISFANSNRDGTGIITSIITGASNGTLIKSIIIKAQTSTSAGTVRLFVYNGSTTALLVEIPVPAVTISSRDQSFETTLDLDLFLKSGYILKATTQVANTFVLTAFGLNVDYYDTAVRTDTTQYTADNGLGKLSTANPNLDGSGTIVAVLTAPAAGFTGEKVEKIHIKATGTTTPGMIRLFIYAGSATRIFAEVPVPAITPTAIAPAFEQTLYYDNLYLPLNGKIYGATEKAESFVVTVEAWSYKYQS